MAIRTARRAAVRWARSAVIALCAALAVLVHHETAAAAVTAAEPAMHGMHMHGIAASPVASMTTASLAGHSAMTTGDPVTHGTDGGPCDATGMQHCAAASVDTVKLAPPPQGHAEGVSHPQQVTAAPVPAHSAGRAPPDLSVLSQLRI